MNDLPPPVALALLVAETVTVDPRTKRLTAHGIFHRIDQCPVRLDFYILAFVTEVTRPVELLAAVLDPDDNPIHHAKWSIDSTIRSAFTASLPARSMWSSRGRECTAFRSLRRGGRGGASAASGD